MIKEQGEEKSVERTSCVALRSRAPGAESKTLGTQRVGRARYKLGLRLFSDLGGLVESPGTPRVVAHVGVVVVVDRFIFFFAVFRIFAFDRIFRKTTVLAIREENEQYLGTDVVRDADAGADAHGSDDHNRARGDS